MGATVLLEVFVFLSACSTMLCKEAVAPSHLQTMRGTSLHHQIFLHDPPFSPKSLVRRERKLASAQNRKGKYKLQANYSLDQLNRCSGDMKLFSDSRIFEVWQSSKPPINAPSVLGLKDAAAFYGYKDSSSHTGLEKVKESFIVLYRNLNNDKELNLFLINGKQTAEQGSAKVYLSIKGVPEGAKIVQADDSSDEFDWADVSKEKLGDTPSGKGKDLLGKWSYARNTDGAAVSLPVNVDWELEIHFQCSGDVTKWKYYFATGEHYDLDMKEPVFLRSRTQEVKAPSGPDLSKEDPQDEAGMKAKLNYMQKQYCEGSKKQMLIQGEKTKFCVLATSDAEKDVEYNFVWGDDGPPTKKNGKPGKLTCAEHIYETAAEELTIKVDAKDGNGCTSKKDLGKVCVAPVDLAGFEPESGAERRHFSSTTTWVALAFNILGVVCTARNS